MSLGDIAENILTGKRTASLEELQAMLVYAPFGIILTDENGRIVEWNSEMERIGGFSQKHVLGQYLWDVRFWTAYQQKGGQEMVDMLAKRVRQTLDSGVVAWNENSGARPYTDVAGKIHFYQDRVFVICDGGKNKLCFFIQDVTGQIMDWKKDQTVIQRARSRIEELEQANHDAFALLEMGDLLQGCQTLAEAHQIVGKYAADLFPRSSGAIYQYNSNQRLLEMVNSWGNTSLSDALFSLNACWAMRRGQVHEISSPVGELICEHYHPENSGAESFLCVPFSTQTETIGLLTLGLAPGVDMNGARSLALILAGRVAISLANLQLRAALFDLSTRDTLTGLFHVVHFKHNLEREIRIASLKHAPLAVLTIRLNGYNEILERWGSEKASLLISEAAQNLLQVIHSPAFVCRLEGERFAAAFPEMQVPQVLEQIGALLLSSNTWDTLPDDAPHVCWQIGSAEFPRDGLTVADLLQEAEFSLLGPKSDKISP